MIAETLRDTSFAFAPSCVCRPRYTVRPEGEVLEYGGRKSVKHSPHPLNYVFLYNCKVYDSYLGKQ